jgi:diguanylate cyclase (GGDEF)-like protein
MSAAEVATVAPRVLIADDSRMVRATIARHIKTKFQAVEAQDGQDAWDKLLGDPAICAVITDLGMPRLDGFGLLQRIREASEERVRALPVIVISGDDEAAQMKRAARLGATEFITKGVGAIELVSRLENLTELRRTRQSLDTARVAVAKDATTDPTTQVGTMALLVKQGAAMFSYAQRHRVPLSVLRIGLDNFESLRDKAGEPVTDQILAAVARLLVSRLRKEDVVARADAAEFAVAAPAATAAAAARFSERLAQDIRGARIRWQGRSIRIAASIGIADSIAEPAQSFADIYSAAGRRLERARADGGNRVVCEDASQPYVAAPPLPPGITQALALLAAGRGDELRPFAAELALKIFPLVKYCDEQFSAAERERVELVATQRLATLGGE